METSGSPATAVGKRSRRESSATTVTFGLASALVSGLGGVALADGTDTERSGVGVEIA
ncbi:MAG TPA: hypothetical protein VNJ28_06875 [Candidatus Limnocylindrales bacterium]|nr:hypothetical protein [Candidatus Limnocylindrales bacterium]